jgi:hydroxymethylglutaryl-CoA lyase
MDIEIFDVSARDGLQNEPNGKLLTAADKVEYIRLLMRAGLKRIEAGSFVRASAVPAMANSEEVARLLAPIQDAHPEVTFSYLVPNLKGLERAIAVGSKEVAIFLAVSEQFSKANINASVEQSFADIQPVIAQALEAGMRVRGYISTVFGYNDLDCNPDLVACRTQQLLDMGCYEVSLGDTTGIATPETTAALVSTLCIQSVPLHKVALHFHDTFGKAIQNVETACHFGIRTFDASTAGLGGCPYANSPKGNLAMEHLVQWCRVHGYASPVTQPDALLDAGRFILRKLGKEAA